MFKFDRADCSTSRTAAILDKIATALDCPVSAFSEPPSGTLDQTAELLRLWSMIEHEQERAKVLSFLRSVASTAAA